MLIGIVYTLMNIVRTYITYLLVDYFLGERLVKRKTEILAYVGLNIIITVQYFICDISVLKVLLNTVGVFALFFMYKSSVWDKIMSLFMVFGIFLLSECVIMGVTEFLWPSVSEEGRYSNVFAMIAIQIIPLFIAKVLQNSKRVRDQKPIVTSYWAVLVISAITTFVIPTILFRIPGIVLWQGAFCSMLLLIEQCFLVSLYQKQQLVLEAEQEKAFLKVMNNAYANQFRVMEGNYQQTRELHHDMKNHLLSISSILSEQGKEKALRYIEQLTGELKSEGLYARCGNTILDSILNTKMAMVADKDISCDLEVNIDKDLSLPAKEITVILCNLIDNAMEAVQELEGDERWMRVRIVQKPGRVVIKTLNPFEGERKTIKGKYPSTKKNREEHGIGLQNVERTVKQLGGVFEATSQEDLFYATTILFLPLIKEDSGA